MVHFRKVLCGLNENGHNISIKILYERKSHLKCPLDKPVFLYRGQTGDFKIVNYCVNFITINRNTILGPIDVISISIFKEYI